ncbi:Gamma-tubulin complex component 5 [Nymphaea thermarum]|nr:Gamma-tubulin complex component 5 [Nymphaea thermarum]
MRLGLIVSNHIPRLMFVGFLRSVVAELNVAELRAWTGLPWFFHYPLDESRQQLRFPRSSGQLPPCSVPAVLQSNQEKYWSVNARGNDDHLKNAPLRKLEQMLKMAQSFIDKLYQTRFRGLSFSAPAVASRTTEAQLVRSVLQMLQGFSSPLFYWDDREHTFHVKNDIHVAHLSLSSLSDILSRFIHAADCLQLVEGFVKHIITYSQMYPPTMKAFTDSVFERLKHYMVISSLFFFLLHGLLDHITCSICTGAEFLLQIVREAVPCHYLDAQYSIHASEMAVHILDYLYLKLSEDCLVQDGEDAAYYTLLILFISSLQPLMQDLDDWLYEGILDDPFEELFFHANDAITIDEASFWQKGYSLRLMVSRAINRDDITSSSAKQLLFGKSGLAKSRVDANDTVCPLFLQELAKPIVSAGKSLQLLRHVPGVHSYVYNKEEEFENSSFSALKSSTTGNLSETIMASLGTKTRGFLLLEDNELTDSAYPDNKPASQVKHMLHTKGVAGLTLSELFCISFVALAADNIHLWKYFNQEYPWASEIARICKSFMDEENLEDNSFDKRPASTSKGKIWCKFFRETILRKEHVSKEGGNVCRVHDLSGKATLGRPSIKHLSPHNPHVGICSRLLEKNHPLWEKLSVSTFWFLPPLNDKPLREAIFGRSNDHIATDYISCLGLSKLGRNSFKDVEALYPFPTVLPCFQEGLPVMDFLPYQKNSSVVLRVLSWIQHLDVKIQLLPVVIVQECLTVYIKKQVDYVGKQILSKLMNSWRLLDELAVLRSIYLLGDLLQQFLTVLFDKLDEGEPWDDYFELNTMLQDSIRNSADGTLLDSPDSLTVTISKRHNEDGDESQPSLGLSLLISGSQFFGINAFDMLEFTYKVSWPLEVIANQDAMRKYNQVLAFLLKVKRAKFVLDKTRRWMWKDRCSSIVSHKHHLLPQQKLLHFVDAFHQYVMDRLVLIASRIKNILGLALDFHAIQRTLRSGGDAPAIKARCEMEVDHIEKQFDDCIAFLLKVLPSKTNVGHFPHLADLVTRINYNYFYMSDDGSLLTVPGVETTASRAGQPKT